MATVSGVKIVLPVAGFLLSAVSLINRHLSAAALTWCPHAPRWA